MYLSLMIGNLPSNQTILFLNSDILSYKCTHWYASVHMTYKSLCNHQAKITPKNYNKNYNNRSLLSYFKWNFHSRNHPELYRSQKLPKIMRYILVILFSLVILAKYKYPTIRRRHHTNDAWRRRYKLNLYRWKSHFKKLYTNKWHWKNSEINYNNKPIHHLNETISLKTTTMQKTIPSFIKFANQFLLISSSTKTIVHSHICANNWKCKLTSPRSCPNCTSTLRIRAPLGRRVAAPGVHHRPRFLDRDEHRLSEVLIVLKSPSLGVPVQRAAARTDRIGAQAQPHAIVIVYLNKNVTSK